METLSTELVACAVAFALFRLFLSGGLLESFRPGGSGRITEILYCSTRHFWRLARLAIVFVVPLAIIAAVSLVLQAQHDSFFANRNAERASAIAAGARVAIAFLLLAMTKASFDQGRIALVRGETRSAIVAALRGFKAFFSRFLGSTLLYALLGITTIALWVGYFAVEARISPDSAKGVAALFLVTQGYVLTASFMTIVVLAAPFRLRVDRGPKARAALPETPPVPTAEAADPGHGLY